VGRTVRLPRRGLVLLTVTLLSVAGLLLPGGSAYAAGPMVARTAGSALASGATHEGGRQRGTTQRRTTDLAAQQSTHQSTPHLPQLSTSAPPAAFALSVPALSAGPVTTDHVQPGHRAGPATSSRAPPTGR
jgi:hypothetical protein